MDVVRPYTLRGVTHPAGRQLVVRVEDYRRGRAYLERPVRLVRHWSGARYFHATTCGGRLLPPVDGNLERLELWRRKPEPKPKARTGGCGGCGKGLRTAKP